ncbi:hypothetical protein WA158_002132 [Blastocystis sp. Blastoise]
MVYLSNDMMVDYFPDSVLLNMNSCSVILNWLGEDKKWDLLYRGTQDGFSANCFHKKCDQRGETVTIIKCKIGSDSVIFGGYTSKSWITPPHQLRQFVEDKEAFIYLLAINDQMCPVKSLCKSPKYAIYNHQRCGPVFGDGFDLFIDDKCNKQQGGWISIESNHAYDTHYDQIQFSSITKNQSCVYFQVEEIEVFGLDEYIL